MQFAIIFVDVVLLANNLTQNVDIFKGALFKTQ